MIYLNNAATSWPKPESVYQAADQALRCFNESPGRASNHQGQLASPERALLEARELLAQLFNIGQPENIVFTANATEALNTVIRGLLGPGDHMVISSMEHNSVARPAWALKASGVEVTIAECAPDGSLDPKVLEACLRPQTKLVALTHASNVTGTIMPVAEVGEMLAQHKPKPLFLVDAAQTAGELPIDVEAANIDFLAFTGHKALFGPPGTGGLYLRHPEAVKPLKYGGTGTQSELTTQPPFLPDKFESGTPNAPGIAALAAGVKFVCQVGIEAIRRQGEELTGLLLEGLQTIPEVTVYGPKDPARQVPVVSINLVGLSAGEAAAWLAEKYEIITRSGLHCAPLAHRTIGTLEQGTLRLSLGFFNRPAEIRTLLSALRELVQIAKP